MSDAVKKLLISARLNSHPLKNLGTEKLCLHDEIEALLLNYKQNILKNLQYFTRAKTHQLKLCFCTEAEKL
jgi:hypothetical protein